MAQVNIVLSQNTSPSRQRGSRLILVAGERARQCCGMPAPRDHEGRGGKLEATFSEMGRVRQFSEYWRSTAPTAVTAQYQTRDQPLGIVRKDFCGLGTRLPNDHALNVARPRPVVTHAGLSA